MTVPEPAASTKEIADALGLPILADLQAYVPDPEFVKTFGISYARQHGVIGIRPRSSVRPDATPDATHSGRDTTVRSVAVSNTAGWRQLDNVRRRLAVPMTAVVVQRDTLMSAINEAYSDRDTSATEVLESMDAPTLASKLGIAAAREDLLDSDNRAPVIQLVNQIIFDAVIVGASDVHIQPAEERVLVRQRIDGVLVDSFEIPKGIQEEVLTRIKVLGKMNIAEKRLPQDGRATVQLGSRVVDLRIASLPTSHNERIVIRLLDKSVRLYTLEELGMDKQTLVQWRKLIRVDHGLILVTGPTGSGKSTTLYGALQEINSSEQNILTLEDPIEYQLEGISQTQINEKKGMTFASGMRSVLRQDPDIIMIGEIRDRDTANMAIQASLTGHLVFSTLHTNDAASAVTRLLDLGVEPYLVSSSLVASLAQRLVRRLCPDCKEPPSVADKNEPFAPIGCDACRGTGYRGRVGLFELLQTDQGIRELIQNRTNATALRDAAVESGMTLLGDDGRSKAQLGLTTMKEVARVTSSAQG